MIMMMTMLRNISPRVRPHAIASLFVPFDCQGRPSYGGGTKRDAS